ncbi:MAG: SDR family NAD(P)-dependent oxidoreductase [Flammeovirgaceae bacterium]
MMKSDIAIIGIGLKFPKSNNLNEFWKHLSNESSLITEVPIERWDKTKLYGNPRKGDYTNSIWGGFIDDADAFDADFFNISRREAENMDPQQRFCLELTWKALEDAGYCPSSLRGSNTGVFMGACHWDYPELMAKENASLDAYFPTGTAYSIIANRISYHYDFHGPSVTNDTACASSLVAMYQAVQALQNQQCDYAIAGGVNLIWSSNHFVAFSKNGMLSKEGQCKAFDESADGYVRGEGGAVLLLKSLNKAIEDNDAIYGVIKGIGINHGGKTNSLTVTSPEKQARLIADIYKKSNIDPASVSYIEAHGTGTPLGDPIEVSGLKMAFKELYEHFDTKVEAGSCGIGSVKTNIGHLEGAAGVAGVIKVLASMQHNTLPANANFQRLNSLISLDNSPFYVVDSTQQWQTDLSKPKRAGVSSFGFGGTNAHVILEAYPQNRFENSIVDAETYIIPFSAKIFEQLREHVTQIKHYLSQVMEAAVQESFDLAAFAFTLQQRREAMKFRLAFVAADLTELVTHLASFLDGNQHEKVWFEGSIEKGKDNATDYDAKDLQMLMKGWMARKQFVKIAKAWVAGNQIDWPMLYNGQKLPVVRLPHYPFAKNKYWFSKRKVQADDDHNLHPLVHRNISTLNQQRFHARFTGDEFFLADHIIHKVKTLPGVCYLEMVSAAVAHSLSHQDDEYLLLQHVVWVQPIQVKEETVAVWIDLNKQANGGISFEIKSNLDQQEVVHCKGEVVIEKTKLSLIPADILVLEQTLTKDALLPKACYTAFQSVHIKHGRSFRALRQIYATDTEMLAQLQLPQQVLATRDQYQLHPVLLDASLQAALALHLQVAKQADSKKTALPFSVEQVHILRPCSEIMWVYVQEVSSDKKSQIRKYDIQLLHSDGTLCVWMKSFASKEEMKKITIQKNTHLADNLLFNTLQWTKTAIVPLQQHLNFHRTVLSIDIEVQKLQGLENVVNHVETIFMETIQEDATVVERIFLKVFEKVKALQQTIKMPQQLIVLIPQSEKRFLYESLAGLLKTLTIENPTIRTKLLSIAHLNEIAHKSLRDLVSSEFNQFHHEVIHYDVEGIRWKQKLIEIEKPTVATFQNPIRSNGVYWITGGLGGLGKLLLQAKQLSGCTLILSGRSALAPENQQYLAKQGHQFTYLPCDVSNYEEVEKTIELIQTQYGTLNGIFHAAGIIRDAFIIHKTKEEIEVVLAPKVRGTINIDRATKHEALDFIVLFSSVAATFGNMGQADYAGACSFMDAFAHYHSQLVVKGLRRGKVISINWPLWENGGMQMDRANVERLRKNTGMIPLQSEAGIATLFTLLGNEEHHQLGLAQGDLEAIRNYMAIVNGQLNELEEIQIHDSVPSKKIDSKQLHDGTVQLLKEHLGEAIKREPAEINKNIQLEEYGLDSIVIVDVTTQLEEHFGSLSKTLFFEYMTLHELANYFVDNFSEQLPEILGLEEETVPTLTTQAMSPENPQQPDYSIKVTSTHHEQENDLHDIAIVGVAGKYPNAADMDEFWDLLLKGKDCLSPIPEERWNHHEIYYHERDVLGKTTIQNGSFIQDIDKFDPRYFKISKHQAELMSPEVRLFLQVGVEALEDAGYSKEYLKRKYDGDVGVIVGTMSNHYNLYGFQNMLTRGAEASGSYTGTIPNMLSYYYGFTGPSFFLDTMCSASSACIDQAVHMLRSKQCKMVVAGGINLLLHPYNMISSSQEHFTTKSSTEIKSYGLGADGTILGEGLGALVLKPLIEAEKDGDQIYGVIKGTAITNAGVRNGFTVPNPKMQALAIEKALDDAGISAASINYLEGHGSGTSLGDPIEIQGLKVAFQKHTDQLQFCPIGSVKSNIGHLLAASGIAGITKVLLQLKYEQIVPSLHAEQLNPNINFKDTPFYVVKTLTPWPSSANSLRRAGITSIGAGGVNSHIIIEEYKTQTKAPYLEQPLLFVISAMTQASMVKQLKQFVSYLTNKHDHLAAISYTLQVGKNELPCRAAFVASSRSELVDKMEKLMESLQENSTLKLAPNTYFTNSIFEHQEDIEATAIQAAIMEKSLSLLADFWLKGAAIAWDELWEVRPQRVSLPTYRFEKVKCWYSTFEDAPTVLNPLRFSIKLHPFIEKNVSTVQAFRFTTALNLIELLDYTFKYKGKREIIATFMLDVALALKQMLALDMTLVPSDFNLENIPDWEDITDLNYTIHRDDSSMIGEVSTVDKREVSARLLTLQFVAQTKQAAERMKLIQGNDVLINADKLYPMLLAEGIDYPVYLQSIQSIYRHERGYLIEIKTPVLQQDHTKKGVLIASSTLAALNQAITYVGAQMGVELWNELLLYQVKSIQLLKTKEAIQYLLIDQITLDEALHCQAKFLNQQGDVLVDIAGLSFKPRTSFHHPQTLIKTPKNEAASSLIAIQEELKRMIGTLLKFEVGELDLITKFYAYGFDSISFIKFSDLIETTFHIKLSPSVFYDCENIQELAAFLIKQYPTISHTSVSVSQPEVKDHSSNMAQIPAKQVISRPAEQIIQQDQNTKDDTDEDVAIIGVSGKFPQAENLAIFWDNLLNGVDAVSDFPKDRHTSFYNEHIQSFDFTKKGGFIEAATFDAEFFNISRLEAEYMDPQHRIALETVWHTVENAGYTPQTLAYNTGIFFGVSGNDYLHLLNAHHIPHDGFMATGNSHAMLVNRISYLLNIHGPSEPIDTACSSSLVAVHKAAQSIKNGDCDMAIAGGVNLNLSVATFAGAHHAGMLSPDGKCQTFSKQANGYVRGEGVGAILLKKLSDAERDGDHIWGVIRGSAVNHGGKTSSITAPSPKAQSRLIKEALGHISPTTIGYVETHGTGTALGDPIEIDALSSVFNGQQLPLEQSPYCGLGALKTNIGHLEAAAGIAGLIKVLLSMRHRTLVANLHGTPQSDYIRLGNSPFYLLNQAQAWEPIVNQEGIKLPLRAGVSSFGFGGVNAHVVLEAYAERGTEQRTHSSNNLFVLSAKNQEDLRVYLKEIYNFISRKRLTSSLSFTNICYTLQVGRTPQADRLAIQAHSVDDLLQKIQLYLQNNIDEASTFLGTTNPYSFNATDSSAPQIDARLITLDLPRIAKEWVKGKIIPWTQLYTSKVQRIELPGYPFAKTSFWLPNTILDNVSPVSASQIVDEAEYLIDQLLTGEAHAEDIVDALYHYTNFNG